MVPSRWSATATQSPSLIRACFAIPWGIRTARLLPHLETVVSLRIWIYFKYTRDCRRLPHPTGSVTVNVLPASEVLASSTEPWCDSAIHFTIESPRPKPPACCELSRERASSAR